MNDDQLAAIKDYLAFIATGLLAGDFLSFEMRQLLLHRLEVPINCTGCNVSMYIRVSELVKPNHPAPSPPITRCYDCRSAY